MKDKPTILKLGGSVITVKKEQFTPNKLAINRLVEEINRADVHSLLLIHGGGSFGHPVAKKYGIKGGYKHPSQLIGVSKTHQAMASLNQLIIDAMIQRGIPSVTIQPSAFITTDNGRIQQSGTKIIEKLLELNIIPVLYGDVVLDSTLVFSILSGDQLASMLAIKLNAHRIIMGIDVDGLFIRDPKIDPTAQLINHVSLKELEDLQFKIGEAQVPDVTGGMLGKVIELMPAVSQGISTLIVNATKSGNIYKALTGEQVVGTTIGV